MKHTAEQLWNKLKSVKDRGLMRRLERYASLTVPMLLLPQGLAVESSEQTHDFQSLGAQCLNHLTNKMMLAMFAPSRANMRLTLSDKMKKVISENGFNEDDVSEALAEAERNAQNALDSKGQRPKLYAIIRHLIALGNILMVLEEDNIRVIGIDQYCVKRTQRGKMHTVVIKETVCFDELDDEAQKACGNRYKEDDPVDHYTVVEKMGKGYKATQWAGDVDLGPDFTTQWKTAEECPYHPLTWNLSDKADYGTGLVEEYSGDLEALSVLAEGVVDGAILASEIRYAVDPTGQTDADDFNKVKNGDAFPGRAEDIQAVHASNFQAIKVASDVSERWEQRIARGFLMGSAVTRQAERVTAEEIRLTAQELETAFGGVYSALAISMQLPVAHWCLQNVDIKISGKDIQVQIITGLDALSRGGDLDKLRLALQDAALLAQLPEPLQARLKFDAIFKAIGQGHGIKFDKFVMNEAEFKAAMQQAASQNAGAAGAEAQAVAQAEQPYQGT